MSENNMSSFKVVGDYHTDIRTLYEAWATEAGLQKWFLRKANFYAIAGRDREPDELILKEDVYEWYWEGWGDDAVEKGEILEANGTDQIKFSFSGGSIVTIDLYSRNGVSIVELTQENIPAEPDPKKNLYILCQMGWLFYMANLKSVLEGGVDLRNKNMGLSSSFK